MLVKMTSSNVLIVIQQPVRVVSDLKESFWLWKSRDVYFVLMKNKLMYNLHKPKVDWCQPLAQILERGRRASSHR